MPHPNSPAADPTHEQSLYADKFNITSFQRNPKRWNKDWEKVLHALSAVDAYSSMGMMLSASFSSRPDMYSQMRQHLKDKEIHQQHCFTNLWDEFLGQRFESFSAAWVLLDGKERTRHLLKGLEGAIQDVAFGQDVRALCPEITVSAMLKENGRRFTDFLNTYQVKLREATVGHPYLYRSEWWDKALKDVPPSLSRTLLPFTFKSLTLLRTQFISESLTYALGKPLLFLRRAYVFFFMIAAFIANTSFSIMIDLVNGSPGMDPVMGFLNSMDSYKAIIDMRHKPIIRCENCTKTPEDIQGSSGKFMVCSSCKSKLDFTIHYCSRSVVI
jgi:hypothetical protein